LCVPPLARPERSQLGLERHVPGHYLCCGRSTYPEAIMATRKPTLELFYDPAELDSAAPRLYVRKEAGVWNLYDGEGVLLGRHPRLPGALDAALERSERCFSEILVRTASGKHEWSVRHNPDWEWLARLLNETDAREREAAD